MLPNSPRSLRFAPRALAFVLISLTVDTTPAVAATSASSAVVAAAVPLSAADLAQAEITVDGRLDESVWARHEPTTDFLQRDPREGAAPSFRTEFRVAFDARALYVAVRAFDPDPRRIVGLRTRRDLDSPSDWIRVLVDSFHDRRTAFEFAVNAAGVRQDRYWFNDTSQDVGWDAVWDAGVVVDGEGWTAEFRLPLSQLRFNPRGDGGFGFAVVRTVARLNETSSWPLLARSAQGYVSSFGELSGLRLQHGANRLELVPYVVGNVKTQPRDGNPLVNSRDPGGQPGLDFKYALTPGVTLTGTVNPDFGQVEADPAVVNLSAFETFFAERRPFFLEGSGIFRFDLSCEDDECTGLFYSRRLGRRPRGEPEVSDDGHVALPEATTILGAAKLTGRVGSYTFGALTALTGNEHAAVADGAIRHRPIVEPMTQYSVARVRREWANQSSLGAMITSANRRVPDLLRETLPSQAYAVGFDGDWRLSSRYKIGGYWAASHIGGDAAAIEALQTDARHYFQRPDADYVDLDATRTSLGGQAGMVSFSKIGGERIRFNSNVSYRTPGFEINEVGFLQRADERTMSHWLQVRHDRPWRLLRSARLNLNQWAGWNFGGDRLQMGGNVNWHLTFVNNWAYGMGVTFRGRILDDRLTRGGPGGYVEPRRDTWGYLRSDSRRRVWSEVFFWRQWSDVGHSSWEVSPSVTVRPTSALSVQLSSFVAANRNPAQWVENVDLGTSEATANASPSPSRYVFGRLAQSTTAMSLRVNYAITSTLSLQVFGRPFVSAGRYADYRELIDGRAPAFDARYAAYAYDDDASFRYRSFRTTNILRWEYRPGSTLFVVWQQGRERDDPTPSRPRDLGSAFSAPASSVFLVKLAYWLNP